MLMYISSSRMADVRKLFSGFKCRCEKQLSGEGSPSSKPDIVFMVNTRNKHINFTTSTTVNDFPLLKAFSVEWPIKRGGNISHFAKIVRLLQQPVELHPVLKLRFIYLA